MCSASRRRRRAQRRAGRGGDRAGRLARRDLRAGLVRARHRRLLGRRARARLVLGSARGVSRPAGRGRTPPPGGALPGRLLRRPADGRRRRAHVDDEQRPMGEDGRPVYENLLAAGATLAGAVPWREKSGDGLSLATGTRRPLERSALIRGHRMTRSSSLMRDSLDHCVKCTICETFCPYRSVTPLFPGPEVRRAAGGALPRYRRPRRTHRSTTARAAAICTQVCPQGVKIAEINSQARARLRRAASRCATS